MWRIDIELLDRQGQWIRTIVRTPLNTSLQKGMLVASGSLYVLMLTALSVAVESNNVQACAIDLDRSVSFNIEAQPVGSAPIELSRKTNIQVLIAPEAQITREATVLHI
jgi:hypothetical protein